MQLGTTTLLAGVQSHSGAPEAVFLFPHPDDEFAVSLIIRDLVRADSRILCIYLTDGVFGGQSAERRERESLCALAAMGVPAENVCFLGRQLNVRDGQLYLHLGLVFDALAKLVPNCGQCYCPAWEGGHQDHDAAHLLALALAFRSEMGASMVWQFPLYHGSRLPGPFFRVMAPLPENGPSRARKTTWRERAWHLRLCMGYPSQLKTWIGLLPFVALHMALDGRFHLQSATIERVMEAPHPGKTLYHRRGFLDMGVFRRETATFVAEHLDVRHERT